uniref:DDE Tnp4 domain-containing protein n=1 Tax=Stegastes partitus TaxID=144197 RepID=A0A3B4Z1T2_9TELE
MLRTHSSQTVHATKRSNYRFANVLYCIVFCFFLPQELLSTIHEAVLALVELLNMFVVFPGHLPTLAIKEAFYRSASFPRVLCVVDCTHVAIIGPLGEHKSDFGNKVISQPSLMSCCLETEDAWYLLTPHPDLQNRFDVALSTSRVRIEVTFGVIKLRFGCLHSLRVSPNQAYCYHVCYSHIKVDTCSNPEPSSHAANHCFTVPSQKHKIES